MTKLIYDDFQIGPCIGTGTVGTVYEVVHGKTGEVFALKLLSPAFGDNPFVVSRFEREILILSKLDHPNIVAYEGHGRFGKQLFYVMELLRGGTLKQLLAVSGPLSWVEAAECGRQLASASQHAHNHGIIHRDLKPGNVYLTKSGQLKLGDFGIARDVRSIDLTDSGLTVGTYAYMSPELIRGERAITGKVDLYALGCLLFELLTGRPPYTGDNFAQIFEQHLHAAPPHLRDYGIACPETLDQLIESLLDKDPEQRPFNARAVQGMLTELISGPRARPGGASTEDRAAGSVHDGQVALANRIQDAQARPPVSWTALCLLALGILGVIVTAAAIAHFQ